MTSTEDNRSSLTPDADRDRSVELLERINDQLDRANRRDRQHDFSVLRLCGALMQMFAIVAALWGVAAVVDAQPSPATARLTLACFLQLAALSAFAVDRFR